jgi:hypothetical protein
MIDNVDKLKLENDELSDEKSKIEDDYDKTVADNQKLRVEINLVRQELYRCYKDLMNSCALIGSMNNASWLATGISFIIAMFFTVLSMHSLAPSADWNAIIGVGAGTWFFGVFVYYGVWRWQWRK